MRIIPLLIVASLFASELSLRSEEPAKLRERFVALEKQMVEAKKAGRADEMERLAREMQELKRHAAAHAGDAHKEKRREMEEMLAQTQRELGEAEHNNQPERVKELRHRLERLQNALREGGEPDGRDAAAVRQKLQHMMQAVEHLRAAGMPEIAGRIEAEAREIKSKLESRPTENNEALLSAERKVQEMHKRMEEMHRRMEEMARRMEEMSRERQRANP
jgi:ElaB/YqjD/DUF883 family membrane-anchored ribosome-binding protein